MEIGELVRVHWGNCDWSGEQGVDWGYTPGVIVGEIRWWNDDVVDRHPCGNVSVFVQGAITSYNIGRCERLPEVNDESR